jgi:hypothetical protein
MFLVVTRLGCTPPEELGLRDTLMELESYFAQ